MWSVRIEPKTATEMEATMIVRMLLPSQTMRIGARADFGRLLSMTRYGSRISERFRLDQRRTAPSSPQRMTSVKLISVS